MIMLPVRIALATLLSLTATLTNAQGTSAPVSQAPLAALVFPDDYPQQAIANKSEGTVRFRLHVDSEGRVSVCTILEFSGSSILDTNTCRLMQSRARFEPARDATGQPIEGQVVDQITWTLPAANAPDQSTTPPPRLSALATIYTTCVLGDAALRAISTLEVDAIPDAAYATCVEVEPLLLAEVARADRPNMVPADALQQLKLQLHAAVVAQVGAMRRKLTVTSAD